MQNLSLVSNINLSERQNAPKTDFFLTQGPLVEENINRKNERSKGKRPSKGAEKN
jgi:hypothetical protein